MGTAPKDNYTLPSDKALWGFAGTADKIEVAPNKATDVEGVTTAKDDKSGRGNGSK
jgi:hypothetical protein